MTRELPIRVAGGGHGNREFRCRPFGHRGLAAGFRRPKAERLMPERLTPVAVTRHLEWMSEYRVWSIEYGVLSIGGDTELQVAGGGVTSSGLWSRVSGARYGLSGSGAGSGAGAGTGAGVYLHLKT